MVKENAAVSEKRFPTGENRDKFLFISGMTQLNEGNVDSCMTLMKTVVEKYPNSRLSEMAGMIVNGVPAEELQRRAQRQVRIPPCLRARLREREPVALRNGEIQLHLVYGT